MVTVGRSIMYNYKRVFCMKIRPDDVWIVTHPKCGTTWMQEMAWHIMNGVDLESAQSPLFDRSPFIDLVMIRGSSKEDTDKYFDNLENVFALLHMPVVFDQFNIYTICLERKINFCSFNIVRNLKNKKIGKY